MSPSLACDGVGVEAKVALWCVRVLAAALGMQVVAAPADASTLLSVVCVSLVFYDTKPPVHRVSCALALK